MEQAWIPLLLSLKVAGWATALNLVFGVAAGFGLSRWRSGARDVIDSLLMLPLVMPPTVLGYYLLVAFAGASPIGRLYAALSGSSLVFTFAGLLAASVVFNVPFAVQPMQRAFEAVPQDMREAAWCSGMSRWATFLRIELPLAWPGVLSSIVLTFAHTLGEFGVVLMVGGSIPGQTKTIALAIYDRAQAFDQAAAGNMAAVLLVFSISAIALAYRLTGRVGRRLG
jgi:molybdate transport system permease protein